jgi:hypothetical protein
MEPLFDVEDETSSKGMPKPITLTERGMLDLLHKRFGQQSYNGAVQADRYVRAEHVRAKAGFDCRTADFVAVDTWASSNIAIHGVEVKVSRSDWLRELKDPWKAEEFVPFTNYWWLAAADKSIVRDDELPEGWGLLVPRGGKLTAVKKAPRREAQPLPLARMAALLRAVAKTAGLQVRHGGYVVKLGADGKTYGTFATERAADFYARTRGSVTSNFVTPIHPPKATRG